MRGTRAAQVFVCALLAVLPLLGLAPPAGAQPSETPAERCDRETRTYNDAWESGWQTTHPGEAGPAPAPPAPYICHDPGPPESDEKPWRPGSDPEGPSTDTPNEGLRTDTNPGANSPLTVAPNPNGPIVVPSLPPSRSAQQEPPDVPAAPGQLEAVPIPPVAEEPVSPPAQAESLEDEAARRSLEDVLADCTPDLIPSHTSKTALTPAQASAYDALRPNVPTDAARQRVTDDVDAGKYGSEYTNTPEKNWQADHVISVNRLVQIPGFVQLPFEVQKQIADSPENLRPLHSRWNGSKQHKSLGDWEGPRGPTSPEFTDEDRKRLCLYEREAQIAILQQLADYWLARALESMNPPLAQPEPTLPPATSEPAPVTDESASPAPPTPLEIPGRSAEVTRPQLPEVVPTTIQELPSPSAVELPATTIPELPTQSSIPLPTQTTVPQSSVPGAPSVPPGPSNPSSVKPPPVPKAGSSPTSKAPTKQPEPDDELSTWEKIGIGAAVVGVGVLVVVQPEIGIPLAVGGAAAAAGG